MLIAVSWSNWFDNRFSNYQRSGAFQLLTLLPALLPEPQKISLIQIIPVRKSEQDEGCDEAHDGEQAKSQSISNPAGVYDFYEFVDNTDNSTNHVPGHFGR